MGRTLKATRVAEAAGRLHGTVSEFDHQKGWGFVDAADGERLFLHYKGILGSGTKTAKAGDRVSFFAGDGVRSGSARRPGQARRPAAAALPIRGLPETRGMADAVGLAGRAGELVLPA